jgi:RNA polymerase sigma-70 factor (ECF subfamily)
MLFKEQFIPLCSFAKGFVYDQDTAKEIVQDVFINLWNKKETIDQARSVKAYLYQSVRNRCLNYIRDHQKFRSHYLDIEVERTRPAEDYDLLVSEETQNKIEAAIRKLPEKCREVFELSRFDEMKYNDIAIKLAISVKTVEVHISKALKILREELKDLMTILLLLFLGK